MGLQFNLSSRQSVGRSCSPAGCAYLHNALGGLIMGAERVGKCRSLCLNKIKVRGTLRCPEHEPEFFEDCTPEVWAAMKAPKPLESKLTYFERKLPPPSA